MISFYFIFLNKFNSVLFFVVVIFIIFFSNSFASSNETNINIRANVSYCCSTIDPA